MSLEDKFSLKKIGTGQHYTAGSFSSNAKKGLAGALRSAKIEGRSTMSNVSSTDLRTFQRIIGKNLRDLSVHAESLPRHMRMKIMSEAESLRRKGTISREDKADLRKIVDILGKKGSNERIGTTEKRISTRTTSPWKSMKTAEKVEMSPEQQKRMKAYIKMDIADELAAEERGESVSHYRAGSALAKYEASQRAQSTRKPTTFHDLHSHNSLDDKSEEEEESKGQKVRMTNLSHGQLLI